MIRLPTISRSVSRKWATRGLASAAGNLPNSRSPIISKLKFFNSVTGSDELIPTYRVLDGVGKPIEGAELPEVPHFDYETLYASYASVD